MLAEASKPGDERLARVGLIKRITRHHEIGALVGAIGVAILFSVIVPDTFPTLRGVARVLDPASTLGIMAIAVALLMIGGEFDLSVGVMTGSTGLLTGMLAVEAGWNLWLAMAASLVFALVVGFINGFIRVKTQLPSFIVTLGTMFVLRGANVGITRAVTDQIRVSGIDQAPNFELGQKLFNTDIRILGVDFQSTVVWWIVITILASWFLLRTRYGSWIFASGGDQEAARSVGVPVNRVKIGLFMFAAASAWLVGMMLMFRLRSALASQGVNQEFIFIIAAVTGGNRMTGGEGSVIGASIGALIFGMTRVGIVFAGWDADWFYSFLGIMLLLAVILNLYTQRQAEQVSLAVDDEEIDKLLESEQ